MKRLTIRVNGFAHGVEGRSEDKLTGKYCRGSFEATACIDRLAAYEDAEEKVREVHNSDFGLIELADLYVEAVTNLNGGKKPRRIICLSDEDADMWEKWKKNLEKEGNQIGIECPICHRPIRFQMKEEIENGTT